MTTILEPGFERRQGEAVGDWMPSRYTPTLTGTEEFATDGDRLIRFALKHWSITEMAVFGLDSWQRWLVRHVLERYPEDWPVDHLRGRLRYRQVVISMGRQNGKSLLGALFVIYFLALHLRGPRVIGLASVDRQAKIVYDRVKYGVDQSPALSREVKTTNTRGISRRDGSGVYFTLPAKEESAQGEPGSGVLYDELHLGLSALWDAMLLAMRSKENALMVGITTAGDDDSKLLIRLYREGEVAIAGGDERFGFFCWEADEPVNGDDYTEADLTEDNVIRANPAIACGRVSLDVAMSDARKMWADREEKDGLNGRQRVIRYTFNRFLQGAAGAWTSLEAWKSGRADQVVQGSNVIYAIERTADWECATITATSRTEAGGYVTEVVASVVDPSHDTLVEACRVLSRRGAATFVMTRSTLKGVGTTLREEHGLDVWMLGAEEEAAAAQTAHGAIGRRAVQHPGDPLMRVQMAWAKRRDTGEGWRISRSLSTGDIDGVLSTVFGVHVATVKADSGMQLF